MHRSTASCGSRPGAHQKPAAASKTKLPRRAKHSIDGRSQTPLYSHGWKKEKLQERTQRAFLSEAPLPHYMRDTFSSRAKKTGKFSSDGSYLQASLRQGIERRPQTKRGPSSKAKRRAPSVISEVYSMEDSALGDVSGTKHSHRSLLLPPPESPEPEPRVKEAPQAVDASASAPDMAAIALTVLFRMNQPKPSTARDLFDIVVAVNRKRQKKRNDSKWRSKVTLLQRRITQSIPCIQEVVEYYGGLSFASLSHYVQQRTFLVAFPLMVLHLASQFPSILATILTVTRGSWGPAFFTGDLYFLNSFVRCLFFLRPFVPGF